jgi:hypothetical protein
MRLALISVLGLVASPVLADAVTYRGTLGDLPIVLELSDPADAASEVTVGRYFYAAKGVDIPLHVEEAKPNALTLAEEAPCGETDCEIDQSGLIQPREPAARWQLAIADAGATLTGTWTASSGNTLPLDLARIGSRMVTLSDPPAPRDLADMAMAVLAGDAKLGPETSPYDALKVDVPLTHSGETHWGDVAFDYVTDPRTEFRYPRIVSAGATDPANANAALAQRHWGMVLDALDCKSRVYQGMNWSDGINPGAGTLGGYEDETLEVTYLSPRLLSFTESGSLFCGAAHPDNHSTITNLEVATGEPLDLSRIFKGWIARDYTTGEAVNLATARLDPHSYQWGPDDALAAFVRAHMNPDDTGDADFAAECGFDELIKTNLAIGFKQPDIVTFTFGGLPYAIQACAIDLYAAPITDLRAFLTPEAAAWFHELE